MSALHRLTATETKLFFREPGGVFFALASLRCCWSSSG